MGGGRRNFMTTTSLDPETRSNGRRKDGRRLTDEWVAKTKGGDSWAYVWNEKQLQQLDVNKVNHVLGMNIKYL